MFSKHRVEALSDGIFAIAMTLLVLDLKVPTDISAGTLAHALLHETPSFICFVVTFLIASNFWVFQHKLFNLLENMTHLSLLPTFVFLALVSLLPFSTSVWGHHIGDRLGFIIYFGNQCGIAVALVAQLEVARALRHIRPGFETRMMTFRLYFLSAVMTSAMLAAAFFPVNFVWVVPVALGITARLIRRKLRAQHEAQLLTNPALSDLPVKR